MKSKVGCIPKLVGNQSWLYTKVGWKSKLVGNQSWLEIKVGWKSKLIELNMGRGITLYD